MNPYFTRLLVLVVASVGIAGTVHGAEAFEAFVAKYCIACHGPDIQESELRIDLLSRDFKLGGEAHRWAELIERVNAGDMPPESEPQPTQDEIAAFVTHLDSLIKEGRSARMAARPPVSHYRLSRKEYQNTVYDLLGVHYDPTEPGQLNEDTLWHGYERIGSELSLSPSHVERYYRAAEIVLNRAFPATASETGKVRKSAAELRYRKDRNGQVQQEWLDRFGIKRPLRYLLHAGMNHPGENLTLALSPDWFEKTPQSGLYRLRLQASGMRPPGGQLAHLRIGRKTSSNIIDGFIEFDVTAPENNPAIYEFEVLLEMPTSLHFDLVSTEGLFTAAQSGSLCTPDFQSVESPDGQDVRRTNRSVALEHEVDRMLTDSRINGFVEDFSRQWLQLHRLGMFTPDKGLYPKYDAWLETSLRGEPIEFFRELFAQNLPIEQFLNADWTMANARLCDFYGLPEPKSGGFERVSLRPEDHRGGLLTMGSVLGLTSDGTRHRPVHRGVWVSETIFNKTPPPPPANVDAIEPVPPEGDKVTIRQRLDVHAQNASCAACHRNIDPLGFAFDQYDAIGQWRTRERVEGGKGKDPLVDASGVMPDGRPFRDASEFKQLLLEDRDKFLRAFIEHLSTYALRRVLTVDDADDISAIFDEAKKNEHGVRDIVRAVALSQLMSKR